MAYSDEPKNSSGLQERKNDESANFEDIQTDMSVGGESTPSQLNDNTIKKEKLNPQINAIITEEQYKSERSITLGRMILAGLVWILLIAAKQTIGDDFYDLLYVAIFISIYSVVAFFLFYIKKIFNKPLIYLINFFDIITLLSAIVMMGEPKALPDVQQHLDMTRQSLSYFEQQYDFTSPQALEQWSIIQESLDTYIENQESFLFEQSHINAIARHKTGVFIFIFVFLALSMFRYSTKVTLMYALVPFTVLTGIFIYDVATGSIVLGLSAESYVSGKISVMTVALRLVLFLATGFILLRLAKKNTDILSRSASTELTYKLEHMEIDKIVYQIRQIADGIATGRNILKKSVEKANSVVEDIVDALTHSEGEIKSEMRQVQQVTQHISEMTESVNKIHDDIMTQSTHVEQSSASVEELTKSIMSVSQIIAQADEKFERLGDITEKGKDYTHESVQAINEISEASMNVRDIIKVLSNIADKTNILAMNATIQAAHAGSYGRSFGVVAGEVRKLAHNSSLSAKEINQKIEDIVRKIERGVTLSENTFTSLDEIYTQITGSRQIMTEIATASKEQSTNAGEVLNSTGTLLRLTEDIKKMVRTTKERNVQMQEILTDLNESTIEIRSYFNKVNARKDDIIKAVKYIEGVVGDASRMIDELEEVLDLFHKT